VAIGTQAGFDTQGANSIAIGALAGESAQGNNSIILNATGNALNQTTANSFTVKPVRQGNTANALYYDASSGEITYDTAAIGGGLPLANGTSNINIATANGNVTVTANGSSTWNFDSTGALIFPGNAEIATDNTGAAVFQHEGGVTIAETNGNSFVYNTVIELFDNAVHLGTNQQGNAYSWDFSQDGSMTVPGNITGANVVSANVFTALSNVSITSSGNTWTFNTDGNAVFPANGTSYLHDVVSVGLATFSNVQIGGNLNYAESANLIVVENKDGFADIIAQNQNAGGNASMNIVLVNNDPGNVYMAVGVNSSNFTPLYNTLFEIPDAGYVSHSTTQVMGPQSAESGVSKMYFTYSSGSYALELNDFGAIGWGASYNGNLTQGNFGNTGQVLTSAGANSPPTWNNTVSVAGNITGGNLISSATMYGNIDIILGNMANVSATRTRLVSNTEFSYIQTGNGTAGSTGNIVFSPYLSSVQRVVVDTASGNVSAVGNVTAQNFIGNGAGLTNVTVSLAGNIVGTQPNVTLVAGSYSTVFDNTGNLTLPGNTFAVNYANNTPVDVVTRFEGTWTVPVGNSTQSFTVNSGTYSMWVEGNIPNGIIGWNATATITNTNVPVVGAQYAWVYNGGGTPIDFTSIPNQFIGTANAIVRSNVAPSSTTNRFDFGINNTSGSAQTVRFGWIQIS
jgi:hypothetical protein